VLIVRTEAAAVEADLMAGRLTCPNCSCRLRPWGHGVEREVRLLACSEQRRLRRSICRTCEITHVLVPEDSLARRRDGVEVIGAALTASARGESHRAIAARLERPMTTVRGWLRRFGMRAAAVREHFTAWAHAIDPSHDRLYMGGTAPQDALEAIGVLAVVAVRRFGPRAAWPLASLVTGGGLLCNTSSLFREPI